MELNMIIRNSVGQQTIPPPVLSMQSRSNGGGGLH